MDKYSNLTNTVILVQFQNFGIPFLSLKCTSIRSQALHVWYTGGPLQVARPAYKGRDLGHVTLFYFLHLLLYVWNERSETLQMLYTYRLCPLYGVLM